MGFRRWDLVQKAHLGERFAVFGALVPLHFQVEILRGHPPVIRFKVVLGDFAGACGVARALLVRGEGGETAGNRRRKALIAADVDGHEDVFGRNALIRAMRSSEVL